MNNWLWCIPVVLALLAAFLLIAIVQTNKAHHGPPPMIDMSDYREPVIKAAEVLEQRRYGRWLGPEITVDWTPGEVYEVDAYAKWILKNPGYGVSLNIMGDIRDSLSRGS